MSYILESLVDDEVFDTQSLGWRYLATIAYAFGWEPKGTTGGIIAETGEEIADWNGSYFADSRFQIVDAEDALGIAAALERVPPIRSGLVGDIWGDAEALSRLASMREHFERFTEFCRKGGFTIC